MGDEQEHIVGILFTWLIILAVFWLRNIKVSINFTDYWIITSKYRVFLLLNRINFPKCLCSSENAWVYVFFLCVLFSSTKKGHFHLNFLPKELISIYNFDREFSSCNFSIGKKIAHEKQTNQRTPTSCNNDTDGDVSNNGPLCINVICFLFTQRKLQYVNDQI